MNSGQANPVLETGGESIITNRQLCSELLVTHPEFVETMRREMNNLEAKWPV